MSIMESFFRILEASRKKQAVFFCVIMIVLTALYLPVKQLIRIANEKEYLRNLAVVNDFEVLSHVNGIEEENGKLQISGWITRLNSKNTGIDIVFENDGGTDVKIASTECYEVEGMQELIGIVVNNKNSGFRASIREDELLAGVCYKVQIVLSYIADDAQNEMIVRKKFFSGKYLYNGKLYSYNPLFFFAPSFSDNEICQVVKEGILCGYDVKKQVWIYQYQKQLYVIIGSDLYVEMGGDIEIPYHLWTSQSEKLPEYRKQNGFDNRDFNFKNNEISVLSDNYHVATIGLPEEYPITNVRIGIFNSDRNEWIWKTDFRPEVN